MTRLTPIQQFTWLIRGLSFVVSLVICGHISGMFSIPALGRLENLAFDSRLNLTRENTPDQRVVIVDIDEQSLAGVGRWPWDRRIIARLVDTLFEAYKIKTLGFDVVFAEPENPSDAAILQRLAETKLKNNSGFLDTYKAIAPTLQRDRIFAESLSKRSVVLGYYFYRSSDQNLFSTGILPHAVNIVSDVPVSDLPLLKASSFGANLPVLQNHAASAGYIDMSLVDDDGVMRRLPLLQRFNDGVYETLALAMIRQVMESDTIQLRVADEYSGQSVNRGLEAINVGGFDIPVDDRATALIPFRGPYPSFTYIPALDVLNKTTDLSILADAIVLIGTTAPGLLDMRATPVSAVYPGVEIHANLISGVLDQAIKHRPAWVQGAQITLACVLGALLILLLPRLSFFSAMTIYVTLILSLCSLYFFAWTFANTDIPIVPLIFMCSVLFVMQNSFGFVAERLNKHHLEKLFGQYVPPPVVDQMSKDPEKFSLRGEVRKMTVLFCDLRGFTSLSENLDPGVLTQLINQYMTAMTSTIYRHQGTIDKYIGDAVMAFWGAPMEDTDHAQHAVEAAQAMVAQLPDLTDKFTQHGLPPPAVGIGINTGTMHVGNMGSVYRVSYTVLGDSVNLASRLENLTKRYGVNIIVGEDTRNAVPELAYRELDLVKVVGKSSATRIYEPLGSMLNLPDALRQELALYHEAVQLYRNKEWQAAKSGFETLLGTPGAPLIYQMYLGRCVHLIAHPPGEHWDPSTVYRDK